MDPDSTKTVIRTTQVCQGIVNLTRVLINKAMQNARNVVRVSLVVQGAPAIRPYLLCLQLRIPYSQVPTGRRKISPWVSKLTP